MRKIMMWIVAVAIIGTASAGCLPAMGGAPSVPSTTKDPGAVDNGRTGKPGEVK